MFEEVDLAPKCSKRVQEFVVNIQESKVFEPATEEKKKSRSTESSKCGGTASTVQIDLANDLSWTDHRCAMKLDRTQRAPKNPPEPKPESPWFRYAGRLHITIEVKAPEVLKPILYFWDVSRSGAFSRPQLAKISQNQSA